MKYLLLSIIATWCIGTSIAQTIYETPHVQNGKTMKFTLLSDFFLVPETESFGTAMFSQDKEMDPSTIDITSSDVAYIAVAHEDAKNNGMLDFLEELNEEMEEDFQPGFELIDQPHIELVNGRECLMAAVSGVQSKIKMDAFYINALEYGDYMVVFYYLSTSSSTTNLEYEDFKKIVASGVEIPTTKRDIFAEFDDELTKLYEESAKPTEEENMGVIVKDESSLEWDLVDEIGFKNDLFETEFTYFDILPETGENWDDAEDENSHLLSDFIYKENNGSLHVFSGGAAANYPSIDELSVAIKKVLEISTRLEILPNSEFANEEHAFNLYSISGSGTVTSFYTTVVDDEMFFFLVDGGANEATDFKTAVRDFMLTMWIASW